MINKQAASDFVKGIILWFELWVSAIKQEQNTKLSSAGVIRV